MRQRGCGAFLREFARIWRPVLATRDLLENRLDFAIGVPAARLLFQDEICPHAAAGSLVGDAQWRRVARLGCGDFAVHNSPG